MNRPSRLDDVVMPPEPPEVRDRRRGIIGELAVATTFAALVFLGAAAALGLLALRALQHGAIVAALLWSGLIVTLYFAVGAALCGAFAERLRFWGGAALSMIVEAKMAFVRTWPVASTRVLLKLLFNAATGGARTGRPYSGA